MGHNIIIPIPDVSKKNRDVLKTRRDPLFNEYTKQTQQLELVLQIKKLDDEIARASQRNKKGLPRPADFRTAL